MAAVGSRGTAVTVRSGRDNVVDEESQPEDGKVGNVVKKWLVYEDRVIADRIQNEEIESHYNKNRQNRRTVRDDIPLAKEVYTQEEAKAQYERMKQLEEHRRIADQDEELARNLQSRLTDREREDLRRKQLHDEEFARHMQEREARRRYEQNQRVGSPPHAAERTTPYAYSGVQRGQPQPDLSSDDYQQLSEAIGGPTLASLQTSTLESQNSNYDNEFDEEALEAEDRELAERLQRQEEERYERKKQQRLLAKERKRLERLINQSQQQESGGRQYEPAPPPPAEEDDGDFSDFYIPPDPNMSPEQSRRLQEEQDAELARLMQDQEQRRTPSDILNERLRQVESQDLELARIIQEEENLRAKRRKLKHQQKILQQQREVAERIASHNQSPNQTIDSTGSNYGAAAPQPADRLMGRQEARSDYQGSVNSQPSIERHSAGRTVSTPSTNSNSRRIEANEQERRQIDSRQDGGSLSQRIANPELLSRSPESSMRNPEMVNAGRNYLPVNAGRAADAMPSGRSLDTANNGRNPGSIDTSRQSDSMNTGAVQGVVRPAPSAGPRQAKIPVNLSGRMMHNTDAEFRPSAQGNTFMVNTDLPSRDPEPVVPRRDMYAEKPSAGRGGYSPTRNIRDLSPPGPALPERRYRDEQPSPPGQRKERPHTQQGTPHTQQSRQPNSGPHTEHGRPHTQSGRPHTEHGGPHTEQGRPCSHGGSHPEHGRPHRLQESRHSQRVGPPTQHVRTSTEHGDPRTQHGDPRTQHGDPRTQHGGPHTEHGGPHTEHGRYHNGGPHRPQESTNSQRGGPHIQIGEPYPELGPPHMQGARGQAQSKPQDMPPYRGLHPPPYPANYRYQDSGEPPPSSPRSAETHYDAPWDMSQLESQLLRDASINQQAQSIKPRQVSPPGRRGQPPGQHRSPPVQGSGGRPLIEQNEDGQIVMNIAEMLDPTYSRRQGQRSSMAEPPPQNYEDTAPPTEGEITAIAGQRRSGKKHAGKRESCKQQ